MFSNKQLLFLVFLLSLVGLFFKFLVFYNSSMAFTYDQGRDLLDLRDMYVNHKLRLIGAHTSLHGVFYGPLWYWIAFPFFIFTGGSPFSTLMPLLILSFLMPVFFFFLMEDKEVGFFLSCLYIFAYSFFGHSIVALNTNPMIFLTPLLVLFFSKFLQKGESIDLLLTYLLISLFFHYEPIIGLFAIGFFVLTISFYKKWKNIIKKPSTFLAFLIPFFPLLLFDIKHDFLQTKTLITLFIGGQNSLTAASSSISQRFSDRIFSFNSSFQDYFFEQNLLALFGFLIVLFSIFYLLKTKKDFIKIFFYTNLIFLIIVFFGFVLYPYALWPWYLGCIEASMLTLIGLSFYTLFTKVLKKKFFLYITLVIFLIFSVQKYFAWPPNQSISIDTANLRNRTKAIEIVYNDANGQGFKIYNFAPYIYDYPYQYLIWWNAKVKYGYLPKSYAYADNQPTYVNDKVKADELLPSKDGECQYLIMEPYESQKTLFETWRGKFAQAITVWEVGKTRIEKICQK